jgi:hypothetical protein
MLKNLFTTWKDLEKHEADHIWGCALRSVEIIGSWLEQPINKAIVQGYIQRCIHDREWYWSIAQQITSTKAIVWAKRDGHPYECDKDTDTPYVVLLTAYLKTLAAQRAIAPNSKWKHLNGDQIEIICTAHWDSGAYLADYKDAVSHGKFRLRYESSKRVELFNDKGNWFYVSEYGGDSSYRVFYFYDEIGYTRKVDDLLGLVGAEHPEQEGLLRFAELNNALP